MSDEQKSIIKNWMVAFVECTPSKEIRSSDLIVIATMVCKFANNNEASGILSELIRVNRLLYNDGLVSVA